MQNTAAFLATSYALLLTHQIEHVVWDTTTSARLQHLRMEVLTVSTLPELKL